MKNICSIGALAFAFSLAACGGSTAGGLTGGGSGGTGGGAGGTSSVSNGSYTLDSVCQETAPVGCQIDQPCCQSSGYGFDASGCETRALASCDADVAEVRAGTMTFDPSYVDACITALGQAMHTCVPKADQVFSIADTLLPCTKIWRGSLPEGASCQRDEQCAPANQSNVYVRCDKTTKTCTHFQQLSLGQSCELSATATGACGPGLYCDAALTSGPPYTGVCRTATQPGQSCNAADPYDLECGLGYYCSASTGVCTSAKLGGSACTNALECQTMTCTGGQCTAETPLVDPTTCAGS